MERYDLVVIGGVAAGTKAAAKARRERRDWSILLVTQDHDVSYAGCGLPYYLGGVIPNRAGLVVKTPEKLCSVSDLVVRTGHRAVSIDRKARTVTVRDLAAGGDYSVGYKKLFLATGASPIVPPIPGADLEGVMALRTVEDADRMLQAIGAKRGGHAVIVGGGFIGIEVAENLALKGWAVSLVEMLPQILPQFDADVALFIQRHIEKRGVKVQTGAQVDSITKGGDGLLVRAAGCDIGADIVLMSVGVRPNSELAKASGLELGVRGAIKVDGSGMTSDPDIYASGDCATTFGVLTGKDVWVPMGSTANKQARAAALALTGSAASFPGVLGTVVLKAFDVSAAKTGLSLAEAAAAGADHVSVLVPADDRAHYFPGSEKIAIRLVAERGTGRLIGAQAYGRGVVDKPIDALVAAMTAGATVHDLAYADFAYAPPFSTAINPVNLACQVLINKMQGRMDSVGPAEALGEIRADEWDGLVLDTREEAEVMLGTLPGAVNIPNAELKARISEIGRFRDKTVLVVCNHGKGAYEGYLRLRHLGFGRVKVLEGGTRFWPYELE
jgi:NADPH-dependent 2,4-dienoyl-CoA reductase/sulfur reductase-like enzyme/rhodanese-related sulfurtransferase